MRPVTQEQLEDWLEDLAGFGVFPEREFTEEDPPDLEEVQRLLAEALITLPPICTKMHASGAFSWNSRYATIHPASGAIRYLVGSPFGVSLVHAKTHDGYSDTFWQVSHSFRDYDPWLYRWRINRWIGGFRRLGAPVEPVEPSGDFDELESKLKEAVGVVLPWLAELVKRNFEGVLVDSIVSENWMVTQFGQTPFLVVHYPLSDGSEMTEKVALDGLKVVQQRWYPSHNVGEDDGDEEEEG